MAVTQNRALGLALKLRGVLYSSISGRKMDSDVLTLLVCSFLGLPDLGLHERVCIYMHKQSLCLHKLYFPKNLCRRQVEENLVIQFSIGTRKCLLLFKYALGD